ncbi:unnamed protein product [Darwinula stevensoni]|uniref:Uncharacterized protein n=1 Tax=Darwinula stevensoni TaxID=69355 RepID=A0A7R8XBV9_9CRUS|nr:unnamed protein product [Darwinula stevensoni]CAG0887067.1 unnamed protein product [Darwinula stevensoni]
MRKSEEVVPISGLTMESGDLFSPVMVKMVKISSPLGDTYQGFLEGDMQGEKCIFLNSSISHPMPCQYSSTATIGYSFPEWAIGGSNSPPQLGKVADDEQPQAA